MDNPIRKEIINPLKLLFQSAQICLATLIKLQLDTLSDWNQKQTRGLLIFKRNLKLFSFISATLLIFLLKGMHLCEVQGTSWVSNHCYSSFILLRIWRVSSVFPTRIRCRGPGSAGLSARSIVSYALIHCSTVLRHQEGDLPTRPMDE